MITKKEELLKAIAANDINAALRIAKDFRIDFNKDQQRILQIAHESNDIAKARFYTGLGINIHENNSNAHQLLKKYFETKS